MKIDDLIQAKEQIEILDKDLKEWEYRLRQLESVIALQNKKGNHEFYMKVSDNYNSNLYYFRNPISIYNNIFNAERELLETEIVNRKTKLHNYKLQFE